MNEALLALLSALVGALIFVVKWLVNRSDKQLERAQDAVIKRDAHIGSLIDVSTKTVGQLEAALSHFADIEKEERQTHAEILNRLDKHQTLLETISMTQARTVEILDRMLDRLPEPSCDDT